MIVSKIGHNSCQEEGEPQICQKVTTNNVEYNRDSRQEEQPNS
jgi:hypothetical protein